MVHCENSKKTLFDPPKMYLKIKKNKKECSIANSSMLRNVHTNFHPNPLKLIYNLVFWGQKTSFFFWYPKKHTKNQKFQKRAQQLLFGNNLLYACQITDLYDYQFRFGRGGGQMFEGLSSYYVHTFICIFITFPNLGVRMAGKKD